MKIVLIGCGYVSVWTYKFIAQYAGKKLRNGEIEIVVVSDSDFHAFHGFTGEFLNGFLPLEFRSTPFKEIFKYATLLQGRVIGINQRCNSIEYISQNGNCTEQLSYDHLVIGSGSADDMKSIPGIKEYGLSVKKNGGILECQQRIMQSLQRASQATTDEERAKYLTFCVIGGGFAGVEVCGNMIELLDILKEQYPVLNQYGYKVHLIYSGHEILPQLGEKFNRSRKYAEKALSNLNVIMTPNTRVTEIGEDYIRKENGEIIHTTTTICTAGQSAIKFNTQVPFNMVNNRISVDPQLRAEGFANIWTGGDAAIVKRPFRNADCRHDALWAIKHGTRIGKNIACIAKGKKPGKFIYPGLGQTASFYKHKAILEIYGLQITGILAWYIRIGFFLYFMPSRKFALRTLIYLFRSQKESRKQSLIIPERISEFDVAMA